MKPIWIILIVIFAGCLICAGAATFLFKKGSQSSSEAAVYGRRALLVIGKDWNYSELERRTSQTMKQQTPPAKLKELLQAYDRKLGKLIKLGDPANEGVFYNSNASGSSTQVKLRYPAQFEKAHGDIRLQVKRKGDVWLIDGLFITSDAFLK